MEFQRVVSETKWKALMDCFKRSGCNPNDKQYRHLLVNYDFVFGDKSPDPVGFRTDRLHNWAWQFGTYFTLLMYCFGRAIGVEGSINYFYKLTDTAVKFWRDVKSVN